MMWHSMESLFDVETCRWAQGPENGTDFFHRCCKFNTAWRALFKLRWPDLVDCIKPVDWQQMYWEAHLQKYAHLVTQTFECLLLFVHGFYSWFSPFVMLNSCLDEAAEIALIPSFNGCIGDIQISGAKYDAFIFFW